jgi:hypothetical protein
MLAFAAFLAVTGTGSAIAFWALLSRDSFHAAQMAISRWRHRRRHHRPVRP